MQIVVTYNSSVAYSSHTVMEEVFKCAVQNSLTESFTERIDKPCAYSGQVRQG